MYGFKKHRGLRRYYKNLTQKNDFGNYKDVDFNAPGTWPYGCHWHFDRKGYGDNSFKKRKPHLDKLFRHFDIVAEKTQTLKVDFQLYAILLDYHSRSDALYLNEPYTVNSPLTFKFSDLKSSSTLKNKSLSDYVDQLSGYEKRYGQAGEAFCLLYKKGVGRSLLNWPISTT